MWPRSKKQNERICILASEQALVCSWWSTHKQRPLLRGYRRYPLTTELHNGVINNFSCIIGHLQQFFADYRIKERTAAVGLGGAGLTEQFITVNTAHPTRKQLEHPSLKQCVWDYRYVCPAEDKHLFYASGIARAHLFQYQLLALQTKLNITLLTSPFCGSVAFYTHMHGATFRQSKLAHELSTHNNTLNHIATNDAVYRTIDFDPHLRVRLHQEAPYIAPLAGLYLT